MANWGQWLIVPTSVVISASAYATVYLTVEQAQQTIFPGARLTPAFVILTEEQKKLIETKTGIRVRHNEIRAWRVAGGGLFIIDEVLGKHEFIVYAVGLDAGGAVKQIEVMDYRESFGYEIRDARWRTQFVGKTATSPLKLDNDIKNIAGATLSCRHITDGVKRLLATYEVALK